MYPAVLPTAVTEVKELMSGAIPTKPAPLPVSPATDAPEETTLVPLGQDTVPVVATVVTSPQKYWVTYWMGLEAGTSADAGAADATMAAGIASVGSLVAVAWSLRSLARQTREAAKQTKASTEATRAVVLLTAHQTCIEIDRFFVNNPDLRRHFYGELSGPGSQDELHRMDAAAEMVLDMFELITAHNNYLTPTAATGWRNFIQHVMSRSPLLRDFWRRNSAWYDGLRPYVDSTPPPAKPAPAQATGPVPDV